MTTDADRISDHLAREGWSQFVIDEVLDLCFGEGEEAQFLRELHLEAARKASH